MQNSTATSHGIHTNALQLDLGCAAPQPHSLPRIPTITTLVRSMNNLGMSDPQPVASQSLPGLPNQPRVQQLVWLPPTVGRPPSASTSRSDTDSTDTDTDSDNSEPTSSPSPTFPLRPARSRPQYRVGGLTFPPTGKPPVVGVHFPLTINGRRGVCLAQYRFGMFDQTHNCMCEYTQGPTVPLAAFGQEQWPGAQHTSSGARVRKVVGQCITFRILVHILVGHFRVWWEHERELNSAAVAGLSLENVYLVGLRRKHIAFGVWEWMPVVEVRNR
ncbi:hypothetical protein C8Q80DRAFT_483871 [Daedaleopsis nitida]|nr:hypothetical protein C8Q80DRAFT_483871 [Daedaleopsis nitida]